MAAQAVTQTDAPAVLPDASAAASQTVSADAPPGQIYQQLCARCHGVQRTGGIGPALLPESLMQLRPAETLEVISHGLPATQMQGFAGQLSAAQIKAVAAWIRTPVVPAPTWTEADIRASRTYTPEPANEPARPVWNADPMNLFVVVESGDHHVSLVDGDKFQVIARFPSHYALHGGPKFSPSGRYVYFGSRDGWITKYDLWRLRVVAEVRAGLNMRNVAVSNDSRWVIAANYLPQTLALFDADLNLEHIYPTATADGQKTSRVSAVYDAEPRKSFVVALKDIPELWEISYDPHARALDDGMPGFLGVRRTELQEPLDDFFFGPGYHHVLGATRPKTENGAATAQVVDLDLRRKVADLPIAGMPHLGSGITFDWHGHRVLASPNFKGSGIDVIDMTNWQHITTIPTPGPGFFIRSHENTPYAWTDSMMSRTAHDILTIIDKRTLKPVASVREPGKTLAHVEFTHDGRYAVASLMEMNGAIIVYDAKTFKEVKRLPMSKPIGKYNIGNKLMLSEGTSH
ncbi:MAG: nitrite reductase [Burkholderiaceae bacterium]|nr:nitrite reductase [Burkholderiaceae bacterium]